MKSVMTDQVFNIKVETENGNYVGEASHVLVLLTNYFADKKIFEENKDGYANILILKDASLFSKLSVIPDLLKGDVVAMIISSISKLVILKFLLIVNWSQMLMAINRITYL